MFVQAGLELKDELSGVMQLGTPGLALALLTDRLSRFRQNGAWDAERYHGQYVDDYSDYATMAIGLYMAAAGVPLQLSLASQAAYAVMNSNHEGPKHWFYTSLPLRNVRNTEIGYELYQSGRITPRR